MAGAAETGEGLILKHFCAGEPVIQSDATAIRMLQKQRSF